MTLCDAGRSPNATELSLMYSTALNTYLYAPQFNYNYATAYQVCLVTELPILCVVAK